MRVLNKLPPSIYDIAYLRLNSWIKTKIQILASLALPFWFEMHLLTISEELHLSLEGNTIRGNFKSI
nr:hypothetical protein BSM_20170 [uncultured archaeon]